MRGRRDFRPAPVLKLAELTRLRPRQVELFVDDDAKVIAAAAGAGFPAVLADWMAVFAGAVPGAGPGRTDLTGSGT